jgi:hypothetical protein
VPPQTSILIIIGSTLGIAGIIYLFRFFKKRKKLRSSLTQNLLRSPGQSLLYKLDAINADLTAHLSSALVAPLAIYALHISISYFGGARESDLRIGITACAALGFFVFSTSKAIKLLRDRRALRLGYEGKLLVGQELEQLRHDGFYVYHDFRADTFNIDHIVVGAKGVFAVETKTRSKSMAKNRVEDATVEYDGRMLYYPKGDDFKTIEQAESQATWLSNWLGKAIGEPLAVRAIVALPGWFIKRTSSEGIPVANPKQFASLFEHIHPQSLSDPIITRITHQLDQACRDMEPDS